MCVAVWWRGECVAGLYGVGGGGHGCVVALSASVEEACV